MTGVAVAAALLALVVAVVALLVSLGTAARVRRGSAGAQASGGPGGFSAADLLPVIGDAVPPLPGDVAGTAQPPSRYGVAFVSTACDACRDSLATIGGERPGAFRVAVVLDDSHDPADLETFRAALAGHDVLLVEDIERPLSKAFGVNSYPAFVGVSDDRVALSSFRADDLVQWEGP